MSDRERWIVYPLLLLSLGMGLRGKLSAGHEERVKRIRCDEIDADIVRCQTCVCKQSHILSDLVVGPDDKDARVRIGSAIFVTPDGKSIPQRAGIVEVFGGGKPLAVLSGVTYGEVVLNAVAPDPGLSLTPKGPRPIDGLPPQEEYPQSNPPAGK